MKAQTKHRDRDDAPVPLTRAFREHLVDVMKFDARNPEVQTRYARALEGGRPGPASSFSGNEANPLFRQSDSGWEELGSTLGLSRLEDGRGLVLVDLDGDGAQDVVLHNFLRNPLVALLNRAAGDASWIRIRLRGTTSNRFGIGARVGIGRQVQELACGSGYQSGNAPELHFGLGTAERGEVRVRWPSGKVDLYPDLAARRTHLLVEGAPGERKESAAASVRVGADPEPSTLRALAPAELRSRLALPKDEPALVIAFSVDCIACVKELRRMDEITARAKDAGLRTVWAGLDDPKRTAEEFARNGARIVPASLPVPQPLPTVWLLRPGRDEVYTGRHAADAALESAGR